MSTATQNNDNQEIDLSQIFKRIQSFFSGIPYSIFQVILFFQKRFILFIVLIITGVGLGYFLDKKSQVYQSQVIVSPNFGSVDYLYAQVDLLKSKLKQKDTVFLNSIGVKNHSSISLIEIEPVIDIYDFVASNTTNVNNAQNTQNFELIKLLSEEGDVNKVITDEVTSKNYSRHSISITSKNKISNKETIDPILAFLNQNQYYKDIQITYMNNLKDKLKQDEIMIQEINGLLSQFSSTIANTQKSNKLVYYNENTQLNEIIQTKNGLVAELGTLRLDMINYKNIIVKKSSVLNVVNDKGLKNKMKIFIPLLLILSFIGIYLFISFYRTQAAKLVK